MSYDDDYGIGGLIAVWLVLAPLLFILAIAAYVISSWFLMKIFEKAGVQGKWRAWVPVYNTLIFVKLGDLNPWWLLILWGATAFLSWIPVVGQLFGLAALGKQQQRIVGGDGAHVAMAGLGRMDEIGGRTGGGKRGGDLAPDMARLAHARDDHPALRRQDRVHRLAEAAIQPGGQARQRFTGQAQDAPGGSQIALDGAGDGLERGLGRFHLSL